MKVYVAYSKESRECEYTLGVFSSKEKAIDAVCQRASEDLLCHEDFYTDKEIEEKIQKIKDDLNEPCFCIFSEAYLDLDNPNLNGCVVRFTIKDIDMDKIVCV